MTQRYTAADREAAPGILAAILADPGLSNPDLQQLLRHPQYRVRRVLSVLHRQGKVGIVRFGPQQVVRWYPPGQAKVVRAQLEVEAAEKRRERNRKYNRRHYAAVQAGELDDRDDGKPIQRRGDAHAPLPFVCRAPASVFHLGGGA